jgi:AraC-like DNA-binding protein
MKDLFHSYSIGHFINQATSLTEFEINFFEQMDQPGVDEIYRHIFYEILWVDEGSSRQTIDFQSYELAPKSLFFISPGQIHEFESWQGLKGGTIMFTEDFFLQNHQNKDKLFELSFLNNTYFNPKLLLHCDDYLIFRNYIDLLIAENKRGVPDEEILQSLLHILLLQIKRSIESDRNMYTTKRNIVLFKQFKNLLENDFTQALPSSHYAGKLNITQHHLNRITKEITNKTATEVIKARAILEAKRMLVFTDLSVSEIASRLNYFDSSYFSKIFKSETKKTPVEFKTQMSERYRTK